MNTNRTSETPLKANYMTQEEANSVMELWAERQREDAARNSMITVHDVAEATQLTSDDVLRLLNEVRSSNPHDDARSIERPLPIRLDSDISFGQAYKRVAPATGVLAFFLAWFLNNLAPGMYLSPHADRLMILVMFLLVYAFGVAILYGASWIQRKFDQAALARAKNVSRRTYGR